MCEYLNLHHIHEYLHILRSKVTNTRSVDGMELLVG